MNIIKTQIAGCFEIIPNIQIDERGSFIKIFNSKIFQDLKLNTKWEEEYYSISQKGVLRGMHFQLPPKDHYKLVFCPVGEVFDAVVDLRKGSPTFGNHITLRLSAQEANMVYIPNGLAHGFCALSETVLMMYMVSTVYSASHDTGVLWSSVGINWPIKNPIISARDLSFETFDSFSSPFKY